VSSTLSTDDPQRVAACSRELLSLLNGPPTEVWAERVIGLAKPLIGADRMVLALPAPQGFVLHHSDLDMRPALDAYASHYYKTDIWTGPRRRSLGLDVYTYDMVITRRERQCSEFWNDWVLANKLINPAGVSRDMEGSPVPASLIGYKESTSSTQFGDRELAIFRLLQPSFDAAIAALVRFSRVGAELVSYIDRQPVPTLLIGADGVLHANVAFSRVMGRQGDSVMTAVASAAQKVLHQPRSALDQKVAGVVTGPAGKAVQWSLCTLSCGGTAPMALVHFDAAATFTIDEATRDRIGLSPRQAQVAELMAEGLTYRDIAERLEIEPNTARRHSEHVLQRLGIHTRGEVRGALVRVSSHT